MQQDSNFVHDVIYTSFLNVKYVVTYDFLLYLSVFQIIPVVRLKLFVSLSEIEKLKWAGGGGQICNFILVT
jgi:hypothetical protein